MSRHVMDYDLDMARWQPGSQGRLEQAAMELFVSRGFDRTTVAEIAEAAGLTERTFFRYFADKREVLFGGSAVLQEALVGAVIGAPDEARPIDAVRLGIEAAGSVLAERAEHARRRQGVIASSPELQERELIKMATLASAVAEALRVEREVDEPVATLAAEAGIAVFRTAFIRWVSGPEGGDFVALIHEGFDELAALAAPPRSGHRDSWSGPGNL